MKIYQNSLKTQILILNIEDRKLKFCKSEQNTEILAFGEDNSTNKEKPILLKSAPTPPGSTWLSKTGAK